MRGSSNAAVVVPQAAGEVLIALRAKAPRVHCITNSVAQAFTANILLAAGAVPSMTISPDEIGAFAGSADALLVNLGTFDRERREAIKIAIAAAKNNQRPWVLDPVLIDRSQLRAEFARGLLALRPTVVRLNSSELRAFGDYAATLEGVLAFARAAQTVAALSGDTDLIAGSNRTVKIANGHPHMGRVTAMGCALSALVAACLAVSEDPWMGTITALLVFGVAGEIAAEQARGPGSFATAVIDALFNLDAATLRERAKVSE